MFTDSSSQVLGLFIIEGESADNHLVEQDACAPGIGFEGVVRVPVVRRCLRGHIGRVELVVARVGQRLQAHIMRLLQHIKSQGIVAESNFRW